MARKQSKKIPLRKDCLMNALEVNNTSIRKLDREHDFVWSASSINRALRYGASEELINDLGKRLNVDPDYLSGKYHQSIETLKDKELKKILLPTLDIRKYPYITKLQRDKIDGQFMYQKMIDYMLISHNISPSQLEKMSKESERDFHLELEDSIARILEKHFKIDCLGNPLYPEIFHLFNDMDLYYNQEPDESVW